MNCRVYPTECLVDMLQSMTAIPMEKKRQIRRINFFCPNYHITLDVTIA